ncbi:MAG: flavodoxin family protein [Candidatus Hermodarchaeota archaeon]
MKILIIYFSSTGRTKKVAESIAERIKGHEIQIERIESSKKARAIISDYERISNGDLSDFKYDPKIEDLTSYDVILFGNPVWGGRQPAVFNGYIKKANVTGKKFIIFCTCRFLTGKTMGLMRVEIEKKGGSVINERIFKGFFRIKTAKVQNFIEELNKEL